MSTKPGIIRHKYTDSQVQYLSTAKLPSLSNEKEVKSFAEAFVRRFSEDPDWTPIAKPESLVAKAVIMQKKIKKFTQKVDCLLLNYAESCLTETVLEKVVFELNKTNGDNFTKDEVLERLEYLIKYMELEEHPIVAKVEVAKQEAKKTESLTPPVVIPAPIVKPRFKLKMGDEVIWSGDKEPEITRKHAILVNGKVISLTHDHQDCDLIQSI